MKKYYIWSTTKQKIKRTNPFKMAIIITLYIVSALIAIASVLELFEK